MTDRAPSPIPDPLAALEQAYDGALPRHALRAALLGARLPALARSAAHRHDGDLAAEARAATAGRRASLSAVSAPADPWLTRLTHTVAHHRTLAVRTHGKGCRPSPAEDGRA